MFGVFTRPAAQPTPRRVPPVHVETSFGPDPYALSMCHDSDCTHHQDPGTGPLPAFIWPTPGCLYAWHRQQQGAAS